MSRSRAPRAGGKSSPPVLPSPGFFGGGEDPVTGGRAGAHAVGAGTLFLVATPIGNLEDITLRAVRVLRESERVLAEDTRRTRILLTHLGLTTPLVSLHAHTGPGKLDALADDEGSTVSEWARATLLHAATGEDKT